MGGVPSVKQLPIKMPGTIWLLLYTLLPFVAAYLSTSAEQGLINAAFAAGAINLINTIIKLVEVVRSENKAGVLQKSAGVLPQSTGTRSSGGDLPTNGWGDTDWRIARIVWGG